MRTLVSSNPTRMAIRKIVLFIFCVCFYFSLFSQTVAVKDTLFFNNGSRIVGELDKVKLGVVNFDPDDANDITIQLIKLKTISATRTIFRIETITHQVYFGKLIAHPNSGMVQIAELDDTIKLNLQEISLLYPFKNSFFQRFSGNLGAGFSYTRSSDFGQMNFNGKVTYVTKKQEISLATSGIYSITDSTLDRDREELNLKYSHYFNTTWFVTGLLSYQRNIELGLERRFQEGVGVGNKYITTKHVYAWARTGFAFNQEKNFSNVSSGTLSELFGQIAFNFFRFTKPEINFLFTDAFYYSLSQADRVRNDGEADLTWEIINDLNFSFTVYHNYDSRPPGEGSRTADFGIVIGLNYTF